MKERSPRLGGAHQNEGNWHKKRHDGPIQRHDKFFL